MRTYFSKKKKMELSHFITIFCNVPFCDDFRVSVSKWKYKNFEIDVDFDSKSKLLTSILP
jgi:hypothetical protein